MATPSTSKSDLPKVLYSKADAVQVTKEPDPTSKVVQELKRGQRVRILEMRGRRYQVKLANEKTGWVSKLRLTEHKPSKKPQGLAELSKLKSKAPPTVIESRTGGSARG